MGRRAELRLAAFAAAAGARTSDESTKLIVDFRRGLRREVPFCGFDNRG